MAKFYRIPDYPSSLNGVSVVIRMLDSLGFRFYWSTEGLRQEDFSFRPSHDTKNIDELIKHVWSLVNWISSSTFTKSYKRSDSGEIVREQALEIINDLRKTIIVLSDEDLGKLSIQEKPFWHIINGPLSDALTHVGQINSFRRLAGNPVPKAKVFTGEPPS